MFKTAGSDPRLFCLCGIIQKRGNMKTVYHMMSDKEPSDRQLAGLMHAVGSDVRKRAKKAQVKQQALVRDLSRAVWAEWVARRA
jgi:hypothetical protein